MTSAIELLDECIADLEAKLNLSPGEALPASASADTGGKKQQKKKKDKKQDGARRPSRPRS